MLHDFLTANRSELIARCRARRASRPAANGASAELEHGIPRFLGQLIRALRVEQNARTLKTQLDRAGALRSASTAIVADTSEIGATAMQHGLELSAHDCTVDQVVHLYGDLCQAVTELASETRTVIEAGEFRSLNRCIDDAIACAVTEFSYQRELALTDRGVQVSDERARALLRELQSHVQTATLAMAAVRDGKVGVHGATGTILDLSLTSLRTLIERSLVSAGEAAALRAQH